MNLVYGSFCPLHEGNERCPCRTLTTNASIWTAAELGDAERVRMVVTVKGRKPDSLDPHGYTPLHLAAQNGRLSVVRYLLEAGASPDGVPAKAGGCGATPLHRAAFAGQLSCVQALLSAGASTSAADASFLDMKTPLHKAAAQGHLDVCVALLEAGADPNARDAAGNSPLDVLVASAPTPPAATGLSPEEKDENIPEACSIVAMSGGGEERDWEGVRKVLERFGGCRNNCGGGGSSPGGRILGGRDHASDEEQQRAPALPSPGSEDAGSGGAGGAAAAAVDLAEVSEGEPAAREGSRTAAGETAAGETAVEADPVAAVPQQQGGVGVAGDGNGAVAREVRANTRGRDGGGVGVPCGECLVPKVVMVRASCCGGLLCKPCVRDVCARRQSCRRCRETR